MNFASAPRLHPGSARGPGLFGPLYLAIFCQGLALALAVHARPDPAPAAAIRFAAVVGALAFGAFAGLLLRPLLQDWYTAAKPAERVLVLGTLYSPFALPALIPECPLLPEGFAFVLPSAALTAYDHRTTRRFVSIASIGFFATLGTRPELGVGAVVAFGATTLWVLAAMHFAYIGAPFGLRGWWAQGRIARAVVLFAAPAGLAAVLAHAVWPVPPRRTDSDEPPDPARLMETLASMSAEDLSRLAWRWGMALALMAGALTALYWLRRWLARRARPGNLPMIFGADVGEVEMVAREGPARRGGLAGTRGEIVRLWSRWARAQAERGLHRAEGETAAEFARRLDAGAGARPERDDLTRIFERAHYSAEEPSADDAERMAELVARDRPTNEGDRTKPRK